MLRSNYFLGNTAAIHCLGLKHLNVLQERKLKLQLDLNDTSFLGVFQAEHEICLAGVSHIFSLSLELELVRKLR